MPLTYDPLATPTLAFQGFTAVYEVGELEGVGGPIRYLVQIRSGGGAIIGAEPPGVDLDADFDGTTLPVSTLDLPWDAGFQVGVGREDWDALVSSGATLPASGDGNPGGRLHLMFDVPNG